MRAGLSTIQQTLTPEAASVLNHSIAEAGRRNHGQTTPLHVAATLLASPSGYLRQACIRSHPNSSHPLQCRALELCFSVALERLPSAQNLSPGMEPPISNALMAALKRAQAHQRRGCPEQQQQPLLAVKVELEQLIVSILDDPSVSRVMREASFSSPAVKATIEQSLNSSNSMNSGGIGAGLAFRPSPPINRNVYLNPRLQQHGSCEPSGQQRREEVKRVIDILLRSRKRNPVLVGDTEPEVVVRELLQRIEKREVNEGLLLRSIQVVSLEKEFGSNRSQIPEKMKELGDLIETRINSSAIACSSSGVILDLGDLKWLVEQQQTGIIGVSGSGSIQHQVVSETRRAAVSEMGKLLARFREGTGDSRLWLIGTATCETYLRCQVYHPTMENEWDLQAVPITARLPIPGLFPRLGGNGILSSSIGSLTPPLKGISMGGAALAPRRQPENTEQTRGSTTCCPICMENYEQELAKLVAQEYEKSSSDSKPEVHQALPQWMQTAKLNNGSTKPTDQQQTRDQELVYKQKTEELMKKWNETCRQLHPSFHLAAGLERPPALSITSMCNPNLLGRQSLQPKLPHLRNLPTLQMNPNTLPNPSESLTTAPGSPVATELVLGCPKVQENCMEKTCQEHIRDPTGCIPFIWPDKISNRPNEKHATVLDADSFKRLFKGLTEKVGWQTDAASAVASTIVQTKSGNGKRRGNGAKGDAWLLFVGPDKVGKRKMAMALSELVCGASPITIRLGSRTDDYDEESEVTFRGKTVLDRIAEAVRRNPFSVIVLEDIDRADMLVHGSIKRAMERGRLPDSHGREIALGSVIFVLTTNWLPDNLKSIPDTEVLQEHKLAAAAGQKWQLHISLDGKMSKRRAEWSCDNSDRLTKPRIDAGPGLSFDLNLAANVVEDDGTENSSDLTVEHGHDLSHSHGHGPTNKLLLPPSISPNELLDWADDMVVFKPVDFTPLRTKVATTVAAKFAGVIGDRWSVEVDNEALEKIVGGAWFGQTRFEEWVDRVLVPGFQQLKGEGIVPEDGSTVVRLLPMKVGHSAVSEGRHGVVVEGL